MQPSFEPSPSLSVSKLFRCHVLALHGFWFRSAASTTAFPRALFPCSTFWVDVASTTRPLPAFPLTWLDVRLFPSAPAKTTPSPPLVLASSALRLFPSLPVSRRSPSPTLLWN